MKTITTKKLFAFILLMSGMFSFTFVNAQSCPGNKIRVHKCHGHGWGGAVPTVLVRITFRMDGGMVVVMGIVWVFA